MKKVLFILRNHFTHDTRVLKEARTLVSNGYQVTIFCLWDKGLERKEICDGIIVKRIVSMSRQHTSKSQKISAFIWFGITCVLKGMFRYDIIHCHDLDTLPIGVVIKSLTPKARLIYDAHEYETESSHIHGFKKKIYKWLERLCIHYADRVITVSDGIANEYVRLYNIPKPSLVLNCPVYQDVQKKNYFRAKFNISPEHIIFLYQGGLAQHRGIEKLLQTFKSLHDSNKVIIFMGYGSLEGLIKEAAIQSSSIYYHEAVSPDILLEYTSSADIGFLFFEDVSLNLYYCLPNKFFEYTMAGLPVIITDLPEMRAIVEKYHNGLIVPKSDVSSLLEILNSITLSDIHEMARTTPVVNSMYNWKIQEEVLKNLYTSLSA